MRHRFIIALSALFLVAGASSRVTAQALAVRTNVAGFAMLAANVGVDFAVGEKNTVTGSFYQTMGESWAAKAQVTGAQLSWRHWFSHEPQRGLYWGLSVGVGSYDIELDNDLVLDGGGFSPDKKNYGGTAMPISVDIGYAFMLSKRWSLDLYAGVGPLLRWEKITYEDPAGNTQLYYPRRSRADFYPTNAGLSLVYIIM